MLSNLALYGTSDVPRVPKTVCNRRLKLLNDHMKKLLSVHFMYQDNQTMNEVDRAIKHWKKLRDGEEPI